MTEVSFHFNVPDRSAYACRLLRKALRQGAKVVVCAPSAALTQLDRLLWTFQPLEFIPHVIEKTGQPIAKRLQITPIWLTQRIEDAPHQEVLLNVGHAEIVSGFESFARVIELVTQDAEERQAARVRWKHYAERGYTITRHDVAQEAGT